MPPLPSPFLDSGAPIACAPDDAAASFDPQSCSAAAEYDSLTDDICEIFAGARKLFDPDPTAYNNADEVYYDILRARDDPHTADLIEIPAGMWLEFDPPPIFLQMAG